MDHPRFSGGKQAGVTLTELLIGLLILGLLAGFGIPALLAHGEKSQRLAAVAALRAISRQEESWFSSHRNYASLSQLGYPLDSDGAAVYLDGDGNIAASASRDSGYRITVERRAADTRTDTTAYFLVTATPINKQSKDSRCGSLSLASTGQIGATGSLGEGLCWRS
jgi:type IV pilus assembly protein PilE